PSRASSKVCSKPVLTSLCGDLPGTAPTLDPPVCDLGRAMQDARCGTFGIKGDNMRLARTLLGTAALIFALQPLDAATFRSSRSGAWSPASTWEGGKTPAAGASVIIQPGHTVRYDLNSDQKIRAVYIAGKLAFARDRDTRLDAGIIKV